MLKKLRNKIESKRMSKSLFWRSLVFLKDVAFYSFFSNKINKLFIDKDVKISHGLKAEKLIKEKNDSIYIKNNAILKVDKKRWKEAQYYERKTWMELRRKCSDDKNYEHFEKFNSYKSIIEYPKNNKISKVIELGCGPFTNLRLLLPILKNLEEIQLLDPLLNDYLLHPNCQYKNKKMGKYKVITYNLPIEEFNTDEKYDMVIMINVLEHCYDINIVFDKIINILKVGGVFVFSDVYFMNNETKRAVKEKYDAGHPIKLSIGFMNQFLSKFDKIYEKDFHGLYSQNQRHDKYFIGVKK